MKPFTSALALAAVTAVAGCETHYSGWDYGIDYYWGPPYWYNALYPFYAFAGVVMVPDHFVGHRVVVQRPPPHVHFGGRYR